MFTNLFKARSVRLSNENGDRRYDASTFSPPFLSAPTQYVKDLREGCGAAIDDPPALIVKVSRLASNYR